MPPETINTDGRHKRWNRTCATTFVVLVVCSMLASAYGNRYSTNAMMEQRQAAEQWRYYQTKGTEVIIAEHRWDEERADHLRQEQDSIKQQARDLDGVYNRYLSVHEYLADAAAAFQAAIVLIIAGILLRRRVFIVFVIMLVLAGAEFAYNAVALL